MTINSNLSILINLYQICYFPVKNIFLYVCLVYPQF